MTNQQDRRERIAAQVLSGLAACGSDCTFASEVQLAVRIADDLIAELDRTASPSNHPVAPEGWVVWDDSSDRIYPIRDSAGQWFHRIRPWCDHAEAQAMADDLGLRVRRWPLDPAEDKDEVGNG